MTRKDYELIARTLLECCPSADYGLGDDKRLSLWEMTCGALANALASDNPRFDRDRFLNACGVAV